MDGLGLRPDGLGERVARKADGERAFAERGGERAKGGRGQILERVEHQTIGEENSAPIASTVGTTRARSRKSLCCSQEVSGHEEAAVTGAAQKLLSIMASGARTGHRPGSLEQSSPHSRARRRWRLMSCSVTRPKRLKVLPFGVTEPA